MIVCNQKSIVKGKWKFFCVVLSLLYAGDVMAMRGNLSRSSSSSSSSLSSVTSSSSDEKKASRAVKFIKKTAAKKKEYKKKYQLVKEENKNLQTQLDKLQSSIPENRELSQALKRINELEKELSRARKRISELEKELKDNLISGLFSTKIASDSDSDSDNEGNNEQNNLSRSPSNSNLSSSDSDSDSDGNNEQNNLSWSSSNFSSDSDSDSDGNNEQNNLSRSSSSSSISSSDSDSDSDSDSEDDLMVAIRNGLVDEITDINRSVDKITYSTDITREPEYVEIPCPEKVRGCEVLHMAFCVYSKEISTRNLKNSEWLKKGKLFPNLEQLKIIDEDLKIVAGKKPFEKVKMLEVSGPVKNIGELTNALSKTPNLEELIFIDTKISQKLGHVVGKLVAPNLIKKVTLQEKDFTEIPDPLLVLPNIEQITINDIVYDQTVIKNKRNSRGINTINKEKLIQDAKEGHLDAVKQEIKAIDLLDLREDLSKIAVSAGQANVLKFLISNKVDVNTKYENGNTLLMEAVKNNYFDAAKVLISKGANVRAKNKKGKTALGLVTDKIEEISSDIYSEKEGANRNKLIKNKTELIKMVKLLGNNGADLNEKDKLGQSLLYSAIVQNDVELVEALLSVADTKNVLSAAISLHKNKKPLNNQQINELRDSVVIDVNEKSKHAKQGNTLLMDAIEREHNEIVKLLLNHGANIEEKNEKGDTALGFAASVYRDNLEIIEMLLDRGADINARNDEGSTPLIEAVKRRGYKEATFLIDKGADFSIKNNKGETALSLAEHIIKEKNWADFVIDGAKKIIEKIKSLERPLEKE